MDRWTLLRFALSFLVLLAFQATAQNYPARTVKIVVPAQPGGLDLVGRSIADRDHDAPQCRDQQGAGRLGPARAARSEEHTSELQSL